jgi:hypothetical protein
LLFTLPQPSAPKEPHSFLPPGHSQHPPMSNPSSAFSQFSNYVLYAIFLIYTVQGRLSFLYTASTLQYLSLSVSQEVMAYHSSEQLGSKPTVYFRPATFGPSPPQAVLVS